jgi:catechol 2,3-dioxygenase-like lactoylglutathione lyase family enzyme
MTVETFWHIGILVYDLDAAIARFSDLLGLHFNRVDADADLLGDDGAMTPVHVDAAFSVEGPPFYELILAQSAGVWGRQQGEGVHHVGLWQGGIEAKLEELRAKGARTEALLRDPGARLLAYLAPEGAHGTRIELVDDGFRSAFGFAER